MQINKENILGNRESFSGNREFLRDFGKRPFLTHLFDWPWPRSVLTGKVEGEEDGDVERDRLAGAQGEAFWRVHHEAWQQSALTTRVLRGTRDSAEGFRQLAREVRSEKRHVA